MPRVSAAPAFEFCPLCQEVDGDGNRRITWNATSKYGRCIHCGRPLLKPRIPNEWQPRPDQQGVWNYLYNGGKRAALVAHRRWGKDDVALNFTAVEMLRRVGNYWHMLPEAKQARKVVWDAVNPHTGVKRIDQAFPPWMRRNIKEQEMMIEAVNGSTWQLVGSDNYSCYAADTEILTDSGWKLFSDLTYSDRVATLDNDFMVFAPIEKIHRYFFNGEMYAIKNNAIDLLVTPNHKFYVESSKGVRKFKRIDDPTILGDKIPATCQWGGVDSSVFTLPAIESLPNNHVKWKLDFSMSKWCAFLGIFLAEGSTFSDRNGNYRVIISQKNPAIVEMIEILLDSMGLKWKYDANPGNFVIHHKALFSYCRQFGKCSEKFIPAEIKMLAPKYLRTLVWWMVMGDGSVNCNDTMYYHSTSKRLVDDFQEVMFRLGYSGNVFLRPERKTQAFIRGREIHTTLPAWYYTRRKSKYKYFRDTRESYVSKQQYTGDVWCVQAGSHVIKVRRNGKEAWCGNSLVGSPPVGIVFSEWAIANPLAWAYLAPILEENNGWALFIYTSRGMNHGKTIYDLARVTEGWYAELLSAEHTPIFTAEQLVGIRKDYTRIFGEDYGMLLFEQEFLCSFGGATLGAYFARQMVEAREEKRIGSIPWRRGIEVETFWDLGVDDSMSIWFMQVVGQSFNFIDYYEASGFGLEHYAKALRGELPGSEHRKKYTYGNYYMPHDASHREMTNNEIAMSRKEVAEALGMKPIIVVSRVKNVDILVHVHIPAVRNMLDRCYFDEVRCSQGISALEQYRSEYDEEKKKLGNRPLHDWTCLAGDTKIRTTHGWIPIKDLNGDEYVWGYSLKDHRLKPAQITFAGVTGVGRGLLNVTLDNGKSIKATPEHRWMMRDESYRRTDELSVGDSLMPFYENGNRGYVQVDLIAPVAESMLVYDITSPDLENFVAEGVVVHNSHASSAMITCAVGYKEQLPVKSVSSMLAANGPIPSQWSGRR